MAHTDRHGNVWQSEQEMRDAHERAYQRDRESPNRLIEILYENNETIRNLHYEMAKDVITYAPTSDMVYHDGLPVCVAELSLLADRLKSWYGQMVDGVKPIQDGYRCQSNGSTLQLAELHYRKDVVIALVIHAFDLIRFNELAHTLLQRYRESKS